MSKEEIFNYLDSGIDKSGNLKKIGGFRKHFPEVYQEIEKYPFPEHINILPFKQKLWHFLKDIYEIPKCKICGKSVSFFTHKNHWGYSTYCSGVCAMRDDEIKKKLDKTKEIRYGDRKYNNTTKQKETLSNKPKEYWDNHSKKSKETRFLKNNNQYFSQESLDRIKQTTKERYGNESFARTPQFLKIIKEKHDDIQEKQFITKTKNNSFNSSKIEEKFKQYLFDKQIKFTQQYKSGSYPYTCDFYLTDYDSYIEINGHWTHGKHPFNKSNEEDKKLLEKWILKNTKFCKQAIYVWTDLDVRKRTIAKENNLNYLEIFSDKINDVIFIFEQWLLSNGK